ncbi:hypothetical protein BDP27DRAFT_1197698, partial [Rhodocollybia butyracea]
SGQRGTTTALAWIVRPDDTEEALAFGTNDGFLCSDYMEAGNDTTIHSPTGQLAVVQRSESVHRFIVDPSMRPIVVKSIQIPQHRPRVGGPEIWTFGRE